MAMKNELEVERIFSHAAALDESGRGKNIIWAWENIVYIINFDKTIILRFESSQDVFKNPIGFFAAQYSSSDFQPNGGYVIFYKDSTGGWISKKSVKNPPGSYQELEDLFFKFFPNFEIFKTLPFITFHKDALVHLDESLSHIEFKVLKGKIIIIQRNIYSGEVTTIERPQLSGLGIVEYDDSLPEELEPIGMRTNDFFALFNFNNEVKIYFPTENKGYFVVEGNNNPMLGIIAGCLYDDIGTILTVGEESNGRKEQENWDHEQEIDRKDNQGQILLRRRIK